MRLRDNQGYRDALRRARHVQALREANIVGLKGTAPVEVRLDVRLAASNSREVGN